MMKGKKWIDFESEIRDIVKIYDENEKNLEVSIHYFSLKDRLPIYLSEKYSVFRGCLNFKQYNINKGYNKINGYLNTLVDFREKSFNDLERLTRALEIYLAGYIQNIMIECESPDIKKINPNHIINFNYTNVYEQIYGNADVFHIHGECELNREIQDNNMVLGIDEYWEEGERDNNTNFAIFKKFVQRIRKRTGVKHHEYMQEITCGYKLNQNFDIRETNAGTTEVYVFGHSLDVTDKDILADFIGDDATVVKIFCKDKGTEGELIANVIRLIGEEKLLEKVNHIPPKLEFIIQQEMVKTVDGK